ncbi:Protein CBG21983 [Caenorhabditis briggsae]|uniref:Protein CBG21983 n=1 Tax=Caenorhabditis briggsae TaxID=6238 RepID=A8Y131_CAEBR|nr:Protein CBG21983 [Caenorhabditis briggsae]CAP38592.1 Protein CBG21983 [Caenorhabditis briggsae]
MENRARFRFLYLDLVTIREVLNVLDPFDYVNFSRASNKCRKLSTIKISFGLLHLRITDCTKLSIGNDPIHYCLGWTAEKENDGTREYVTWPDQSQEIVQKHSENPLDSMKELYLYVRSLMGINIISVDLFMNSFEGQCREIVDSLRSTFDEVTILRIFGKDQRQDEIEYILDNMKHTNQLEVNVDTMDRLPLKIPETIERLQIEFGSWLTLDYMMNLKISTIVLWNTFLTNEDLNVIFKSWMEMKSYQNLEYLEMNLRNLEDCVEVAMKDIPYEIRHSIPTP